MGHISGENRYQTKLMWCLDDQVDEDSVARVIDRFVESINLEELGFKNVEANALGRNSYNPRHLAKLYIYGYECGIRSSRKLENLAKINIEVMWLMDELKPDFKTIADFRRDNTDPFVRLLSEYNSFADYCGLFGKSIVAIDGTKIRANNSKKNHYSKKKLLANIALHERRIREYVEQLDAADNMDEAMNLTEKIRTCEERRKTSEERLDELKQSGVNEMATVDADARLMVKDRLGVEMGYNVQASVDSKEHLVAAFDVTQSHSDHGLLAPMIEKTQEELRKKDIVALADKGYYGHEDIEASEKTGALPIVAKQSKPGEKAGSRFSLDKFVYEHETDCYICPAENTLHPHSRKTTIHRKFFNKEACKACPSRMLCVKGKEKFRSILRRPESGTLERADARYRDNVELYKLRQQIVEHVFGTVKRTMNGGYYLLRSREKVKAETALLFLCYNIKRTKTVLGTKRMMELMDEWRALYLEGAHSPANNFVRNIHRLLRSSSIFAAFCVV
jgi:transposase